MQAGGPYTTSPQTKSWSLNLRAGFSGQKHCTCVKLMEETTFYLAHPVRRRMMEAYTWIPPDSA